MADNDTAGAAAPAKSERTLAAEAIIALMAPGAELSQMTVSHDGAGNPTIIAIYLKPAT